MTLAYFIAERPHVVIRKERGFCKFDRYMGVRRKHAAVMMWQNGWDTLRIAEKFSVPEWYVYKRLPSWRWEEDEAEA